ncbi:probable E3 SUMO-protein ligase RNF212 isoform X3 [Leucoraja erinacea]|nr:probable E3 SUMO-protein ligase RNF212 isoform X3 [Leucoraja erinacea]
MDPNLKALFTQPEKVCEMYLKEFMQIMDFQEKHRRHLCAKETEEKAKLKVYVEHITQRKEQLQCELAESKNYITKLESTFQQRQQTSRLSTPSGSRDFLSTPSLKSAMYSSVPLSRPSSTEMAHKMEIDGRPSSSGKSDSSMGPPRLSLLSPPKDGRMGTVPQRVAGKLGSFRYVQKKHIWSWTDKLLIKFLSMHVIHFCLVLNDCFDFEEIRTTINSTGIIFFDRFARSYLILNKYVLVMIYVSCDILLAGFFFT